MDRDPRAQLGLLSIEMTQSLPLTFEHLTMRCGPMIIVAGLLFGALTSPCATAAPSIGAMAPRAALLTLDGERIDTRDLDGKVVVLTFWATWCVPCRRELPALSDYAAKHANDGLIVLGFALDEPDQRREVAEIAETLRFPVGFLQPTSAPGYGRIWRMPANFTIDRAGRLRDNAWLDKDPGWTPERLERVITPLLNERPSGRDQP